MTEITRVPIQPVAKGSLTKLWIGVILAVLVGAGLAWAAVPRSFSVDVVQAGTGPTAAKGEVVFVKYKGKIAATGAVFEDAQTSPFPMQGLFPEGTPFLVEEGATIAGFYEGLQQMQKGGKYNLFIPASQAYGATPPPNSEIPANADLEFEIEVTGIMTRETFERNFQILQQQMQAQMGAGAPGGPGGEVPAGEPQMVPGQ